jgi:hypothetical protein
MHNARAFHTRAGGCESVGSGSMKLGLQAIDIGLPTSRHLDDKGN